MLPKVTTILVMLVLAGTTIATAATPQGCDRQVPNEGRAHPLKDGHYIFLEPTTDITKIGFWKESNGQTSGLQTQACIHDLGHEIYAADTKVNGAVLV